MNQNIINQLTEIGLTQLEARIYIILSQESNLTGYKIAQLLNKPVPNTYKSLESLQKKGIIVSSESTKSRFYNALPINDYMDQMERNLKTKREQLEKELKNINTSPMKEGIYKIENIEQLYDRVTKMIENAKEIVAIDICPGPLNKILKNIESIPKSKIKVLLKVYSPITIPGCDITYSEFVGSPLDEWPVEWIHIIVDGMEHVTAFLDKENQQISQAIWSKSPLLSLVAHNGFACEIMLTRILNSLNQNTSKEDILEMIESYQSIRTKNIKTVSQFISNFNKKK